MRYCEFYLWLSSVQSDVKLDTDVSEGTLGVDESIDGLARCNRNIEVLDANVFCEVEGSGSVGVGNGGGWNLDTIKSNVGGHSRYTLDWDGSHGKSLDDSVVRNLEWEIADEEISWISSLVKAINVCVEKCSDVSGHVERWCNDASPSISSVDGCVIRGTQSGAVGCQLVPESIIVIATSPSVVTQSFEDLTGWACQCSQKIVIWSALPSSTNVFRDVQVGAVRDQTCEETSGSIARELGAIKATISEHWNEVGTAFEDQTAEGIIVIGTEEGSIE